MFLQTIQKYNSFKYNYQKNGSSLARVHICCYGRFKNTIAGVCGGGGTKQTSLFSICKYGKIKWDQKNV